MSLHGFILSASIISDFGHIPVVHSHIPCLQCVQVCVCVLSVLGRFAAEQLTYLPLSLCVFLCFLRDANINCIITVRLSSFLVSSFVFLWTSLVVRGSNQFQSLVLARELPLRRLHSLHSAEHYSAPMLFTSSHCIFFFFQFSQLSSLSLCFKRWVSRVGMCVSILAWMVLFQVQL